MNDLDRKIRETLQKQDAELFGDLQEEPGVFEMMFDQFRGRQRWLAILSSFWILVFFVSGILCVVNFFGAETTRDQIMWASACLLCLSAVSMLKLMYWMDAGRNAVTREIKRMELQIARLAARINDRNQ